MRGKAGAFSRRILQPTSFSGLTGWWDAADSATLFNATSGGSTVAADGGVARWEDKSGNGRHFTQATSASRPLRKTGIRNGLDVVRFDGSDDSMVSSWLWQNIISATAHTVFAVAVASSVTTDSGSPFENQSILGDPATGATHIFFFQSSDLVGTSGLYFSWASATRAYVAGAWAQFTSTYSSATLGLRVNGDGTGTDASVAEFQYLDLGGPSLGAAYSGNFHGDIAEVVAYNVALSAGDREAVESYLMDKWAIT